MCENYLGIAVKKARQIKNFPDSKAVVANLFLVNKDVFRNII